MRSALVRRGFFRLDQFHAVGKLPKVVSNPGNHCRANLECLMLSHEVVVHEVQSDCMPEVVNLLAEGVGQSGEPSHAHTHGQVLALHH